MPDMRDEVIKWFLDVYLSAVGLSLLHSYSTYVCDPSYMHDLSTPYSVCSAVSIMSVVVTVYSFQCREHPTILSLVWPASNEKWRQEIGSSWPTNLSLNPNHKWHQHCSVPPRYKPWLPLSTWNHFPVWHGSKSQTVPKLGPMVPSAAIWKVPLCTAAHCSNSRCMWHSRCLSQPYHLQHSCTIWHEPYCSIIKVQILIPCVMASTLFTSWLHSAIQSRVVRTDTKEIPWMPQRPGYAKLLP